jgi:hypothetical protein
MCSRIKIWTNNLLLYGLLYFYIRNRTRTNQGRTERRRSDSRSAPRVQEDVTSSVGGGGTRQATWPRCGGASQPTWPRCGGGNGSVGAGADRPRQQRESKQRRREARGATRRGADASRSSGGARRLGGRALGASTWTLDRAWQTTDAALCSASIGNQEEG